LDDAVQGLGRKAGEVERYAPALEDLLDMGA